MAQSTQLTYKQGLKAFDEFCNIHGISCSWPLDSNLIMHFVAYMSLSGKSFSTAKTYLAGISAKHKLNNWDDPTDTFIIKKILQGFARSHSHKDSRCPVTFQKLLQLIPALNNVCRNTYEALLFKTAFTFAFFGFFRISELIGQSKGGRGGLEMSEVKMSTSRIKIHLRGSKTDQLGLGEVISLTRVPKEPTVCPVQSLSKFIDARPKSEKLFVHLDGSVLTRYQFQAVLRKAAQFLGWQPQKFASHSFRIGAATTAAMNGVTESAIMKKGRWKSGAVKSYIRKDLA